jgi:cytochrome d ubiquinol oxidase subunit II
VGFGADGYRGIESKGPEPGTPIAFGSPMYISNAYTVLAGATGLVAVAMHGALWLGVRGPEAARERAASLAHRFWWAVVGATCALAAFTLASRPQLVERFAAAPWGCAFPVIGLSGLLGVFLCKAPETTALAFLSSWGFLIGVGATAAFGVYSQLLPAGGRTEGGLTLAWWMPIVFVAASYAVFTYSRFAGKLQTER